MRSKMALLLRSCWLLTLLLVGVLRADFEVGKRAFERGDFAAAMREWQPLAKQGDPQAQLYLGFMYAKGTGIPQNLDHALKWFRLAAKSGNPKAEFTIGQL